MANSRDNPNVHRAQDVRQGEVILRSRWQRAVFVIGLAGGAALAIALFIVGVFSS